MLHEWKNELGPPSPLPQKEGNKKEKEIQCIESNKENEKTIFKLPNFKIRKDFKQYLNYISSR